MFNPSLSPSWPWLYTEFTLALPSHWCWGMGSGGCSQFITHCLYCSFLFRERHSSHCVPAPTRHPSHGIQFSMYFSIMDPSHGLQFFTSCSSVGPVLSVLSLRWCRSPTESQILAANPAPRMGSCVHRACWPILILKLLTHTKAKLCAFPVMSYRKGHSPSSPCQTLLPKTHSAIFQALPTFVYGECQETLILNYCWKTMYALPAGVFGCFYYIWIVTLN